MNKNYIMGCDPFDENDESGITIVGYEGKPFELTKNPCAEIIISADHGVGKTAPVQYPLDALDRDTKIHVDLETSGMLTPFPIEKLIKQRNKILKEIENMESKLKNRKFYHSFEFKNRQVTFCLLAEEQLLGSPTVKIGYAVRVPEDAPTTEEGEKKSQKLARSISLGRAEKNVVLDTIGLSKEFAFDGTILKGIARVYERKLKHGDVEIKGIKVTKSESELKQG